LKKKPESFPKDAFDVFCKLFEKFAGARTASRKFLEFRKYILKIYKILPTILHGKNDVISSSEHSNRSQEDTENVIQI